MLLDSSRYSAIPWPDCSKHDGAVQAMPLIQLVFRGYSLCAWALQIQAKPLRIMQTTLQQLELQVHLVCNSMHLEFRFGSQFSHVCLHALHT